MSARGRCGLLGLALALAPALVAAQEPLRAEPGTIVRWRGTGLSGCAMDARTWAPLAGVCYFPIDLARSGSLEIALLRGDEREASRVEIGGYPYPEEKVTVEESFVHLSSRDLERSRRESEAIARLWQLETEAAFSLPLGQPLARLPEGRNFGSRRVFNGEPRDPHTGVDFSAETGTPVLAVADGRVALAADHFFGGRTVFVDHGGGLVSMSMHLDEMLVATGDVVRRGQTIGRVGATGRVSGPHLHFGVRWHGARVDPLLLLAPTSR